MGIFSTFRSKTTSRLGHSSHFMSPKKRGLRFEPLEDRRMLAIITVNSLSDGAIDHTDDATNLTLRDAIAQAADETTNPGADEIVFADSLSLETTPGTITLTEGQLTIDSDLTIAGPGADQLTVDGSQKSRVFYVTGESTEATLNGLTITGGQTTDSGSNSAHYGGGIYNYSATLTVSESTISGNSAHYGGGIHSRYGTLKVTESTISGNSAQENGGGIYNNSGTLAVTQSTISGNSADSGSGGGIGNYYQAATLTVTESTISENSAHDSGGGIDNFSGPVTLTQSTISGNSAQDNGGGIYDNSGTLTVTQSTISGNSAQDNGGGVYSIYCELTVTQSTVSGNSADSGAGGGIYNYSFSDALTITQSTISENSAQFSGGGIYNDYSGTLTVTQSLISGNSADSGSGGGIYNDSYSASVVQSTISGNSAEDYGGGIYNVSNTLTINNTIVALNMDSSGIDIYGAYDDNNDSSLIGVDPLFIDPDGGDYRLQPSSPAINGGDNSLLPADTYDLDGDGDVAEPLPVDLDCNPRVLGECVNIGAYESPGLAVPQEHYLVGDVDLSVDMLPGATLVELSCSSGGNRVDIGSGMATSNSFTWDTTTVDDGPVSLAAEYFDDDGVLIETVSQRVVVANNVDFVIHRTSITADTTWAAGVHVVTENLEIAAGATLTIEPDAVIKFLDGTSLTVADGASLVANGAVFTHIADDTIGGDANLDGNATLPQSDQYSIAGDGTISLGDSELRYLTREYSGTLSTSQIWQGRQVIWLTGDVTIPSGVQLDIQPGAIIKLDPGVSITVQSGGTLNAIGTLANPIVFTSTHDDAYGGDTNQNDEETQPQAGDWHQIFANGGTVHFNHVRVSYCSQSNNEGGLYVSSGGAMTFDNSVISETQYDAMRNNGGIFTATNSIFTESSLALRPSSGTSTLTNCTIANVTTAVRGGAGTFTNCVFANVADTIEEWGPSTFRYCAFWNREDFGPQSTNQVGTNGNIWADPIFRDAENGDFTLLAGSPLIDGGDGTVAPATDALGRERFDDPYVVDTGVADADGACPDIGAYEMVESATSDLDVTVNWLEGPSMATVGDTVTLRWQVTNIGTKAISETWRDTITMVSDAGQEITVGDVQQTTSIGVGESIECTAQITIPAMSEGNWQFQVQLNAYRDVFEGQNIYNNVAQSDGQCTIAVPVLSTAEGVASQTVSATQSRLYKLTLPAGQSLLVAGESTEPISIIASSGFAPTANSFDWQASGYGDCQYSLSIPESTEERTMYVRVSTTRSNAVFSLSCVSNPFSLDAVSTDEISNSGSSTLTVTGSGFEPGMIFRLQKGPTTPITGELLDVPSASSASVRFDMTGAATGVYTLSVTSADGSRTASLTNAVTVVDGVGESLEAWLEIPDTVREGRVYTGYACYANTGDVDILAPSLYVESDTDVQFAASSEDLDDMVTSLALLGVSPTSPAGTLKPGESSRVAFYFVAGSETSIQLLSLANENGAIGLEHWSTWQEYHEAIADAATRLGRRGDTSYDYSDCRELAVRLADAQPVAAVSGHLRNADTGESLADYVITATSDESGEFVEVVTDESGFFSLRNLDGNASYTLEAVGLCELSTTSVTFADPNNDINDLTIAALPIGTITGTIHNTNVAFSAAGILVGAVAEDGTEYTTVTDTFGYYAFDALLSDVYTVMVQTDDYRYALPATDIVLDAVSDDVVLDFTLQDGACLTGVVTDATTGDPIADVEVSCSISDVPGLEYVAVSNELGEYSINGVPLGTCKINAYAEGWQLPPEQTVAASTAGDTYVCDVGLYGAVIFFALPAGGVAPLSTTFEIPNDSYAEGYTYAWDFDSDGVIDSTEAEPDCEYSDPGEYTVTLVVTANGVSETYVAVDYIDVCEPIETVVKDKVLVVDDDDAVTIVSATETELVIQVTGSPSAPIEVDTILVSEYGEGLARKIVGVSQQGNTYTLETVAAGIGDIFESVQVSGVMELTDEDMMAMGFELVSMESGTQDVAAAASKEGSVWNWSGEAGIAVTTSASVSPTIDFELRWTDDDFYFRVVPQMTFELSADVEFFREIKYEFDESIVLFTLSKTFVFWAGWVPVIVPVKVPLSVGVEGNISGKLAVTESASVAITIGAGVECEDGEFNPILVATKRHTISPCEGEFTGSAEAKVYGKIEAKASLYGVSSIVVNAKRFLGLSIDVYPELGASLKAGTTYKFEANIVDVEIEDWKLKYGYSISHTDDTVLAAWNAAKAEFSASPTSGEAPLMVSFKDESEPGDGGDIKSWKWDFGDGTTSTEQNPTHTYDEEGEYEVTLTIVGNWLTYAKPATTTIHVGEKQEEDEKEPETPQSCDPNEIAGPVGYDTPVSDHWIQDGQQMTYTIYFENQATATGAAQEIFVSHQLSESLDWSTFQVQELVFNNQVVSAVEGRAAGSVTVDQDDASYQVIIDTSIDYATGEVKWYLRSYDANTFDHWPADPYAGFLPPNDETHCGEGHITFTIMAKDDLQTGDTIYSEAEIIFDTNDPIVTDPSWTNTIDVDSPTSSVAALPATVATSSFTVAWAGTDVGSGVASYDVYVAENSGPWTLWLDDTTGTSAQFTGQSESVYSFYCLAQDHVGLVEDKSPTAEVTVHVVIENVSSILYVDDDSTAIAASGESWASAFADLQDALNMASTRNSDDDDTNNVAEIRVAAGAYYPSERLFELSDPRAAVFSLLDQVALVGGYAGLTPETGDSADTRRVDAYMTTLSGDLAQNDTTTDASRFDDNAYSVVCANWVDGAIVDGFVIEGGNSDHSDSRFLNRGGGLWANGSTLEIANVLFQDNQASVSGGGAHLEASTVHLQSVEFSYNEAGGGGGLSTYRAEVMAEDCTFSHNVATSAGGGWASTLGSIIAQDMVFALNQGGIYGGGLKSNGTSAEWLNVKFLENEARLGAGLYLDGEGAATLTNAIFFGNGLGEMAGSESCLAGGGVYVYKTGTVYLVNSTIAGNHANSGGGVFAVADQEMSAEVSFSNSIVAANSQGTGGDIAGLMTAQHSLVGDGTGMSGTSNGVDGNLVGTTGNPVDPRFVDLDNGDFRLRSNSPAVDAGDNDLLPTDTTDLDADGNTTEPLPMDIDGNTRIMYETVDIGALERQIDTSPPTADAGGPYTVVEGYAVQLDASGSTDPDLPNDTLTYAWDFDGDGEYDDATGVTPTFSAAGLNGPATVTVGLRVTDDDGASDTATADINVTADANDTTPPVAALTSAPNVTVAGATFYEFQVTYTDDIAVDISSIDSFDLLAWGPGLGERPQLVSIDLASDGSPCVATYRITPPGGSWDASDNGTYWFETWQESYSVCDTAGNSIPEETWVGQFVVNIPTPGVRVQPSSGLTVSEDGTTATFTVVLDSPPSANVQIAVSSGDSSEGVVDSSYLLFTQENWDTPQSVTVSGVDDVERDGDVAFSILLGPVTSDDSDYAAIDPIDVAVTTLDDDPAIGPVIDLGVVDYRQIELAGLASGDLYYRLETTRTGFLTVVADAEVSDSLTIALYNSTWTEPPLATISLVEGSARIDWNVSSAETFGLLVTGTASGSELTLVNLVQQTGTEVTVTGTHQEDVFVFEPGELRNITINEVTYSFEDSEAATVSFHGGDGADVARLYDTSGNESLEAWPNRAELVNEAGDSMLDYSVTVDGIESLLAYATRGGYDVATIHGSDAADKFKSYETSARLRAKSNSYALRAKAFDGITADAGDAGNDLAVFNGTAANERFEYDGGEDTATIMAAGRDHSAIGFENVVARAGGGNQDLAYFTDTGTDDVLYFKSHKTVLVNSDVKITARAFDEAYATASEDGFDVARIYDTAADEFLQVSGDTATLYRKNGSELDLMYAAIGFERVKAYSTAGDDSKGVHDHTLELLLYGWDE